MLANSIESILNSDENSKIILEKPFTQDLEDIILQLLDKLDNNACVDI